MNSVILGAVKGYRYELIRPFVRSLKRVGFEGDVCLFVTDLPRATRKALAGDGVRLVPCPHLAVRLPVSGKIIGPDNGRFRFLHRRYPALIPALSRLVPGPAREARLRVACAINQINTARYLAYLPWLERHGQGYDHIVIADVRDVLFQRDPFDWPLGEGLHCFLEEPRNTIAVCPFNSAWIRLVFGEEELSRLGTRVVSCSGVSLGAREAMLGYLGQMAAHILRLRSQMTGIDQGIHNYLVHTGRIPNLTLWRNGTGPVLTMGYGEYRVNDEGTVLNEDGTVPAVLHQYDRHPPEFQRRLLAKLVGD